MAAGSVVKRTGAEKQFKTNSESTGAEMYMCTSFRSWPHL